MSRHMNYSEKLVSKQHGVFLRPCKMGVNLGMSVIMMTCKVQRLLVKRRSDGAVHLTLHGEVYSLDDRLESGVSTLHSHLSLFECFHINELQVDYIHRTKLVSRFRNIFYGMYLQTRVLLARHIFHHPCVTSDKRSAFVVCFLQAKSLKYYFRTDTSRVPHRYCQYRLQVVHCHSLFQFP